MKNLENEIKALEEKLLHSDIRKNPEILNQLLAKEFEEVGSIGKISNRDAVVNWLVNKESNARWMLSEFRVKPLSPDIVIAIYHVKQIKSLEGSSKGSMRSSIWKRNNNQWQMVFHQGTKILFD